MGALIWREWAVRATLVNAGTLAGAFGALWLLGSPEALRTPSGLGAAAVGIGVATALCVRLGLTSGAIWLTQAPGLARFWLTAAAAAPARVSAMLWFAAAGSRGARPTVALRKLGEEAPGRGLLALGLSIAPGVLVISLDPAGYYLHGLDETRLEDAALSALEAAAQTGGVS